MIALILGKTTDSDSEDFLQLSTVFGKATVETLTLN
jgi:hypothetical protein